MKTMHRFIALILSVLFLLCGILSFASAEAAKEYRDEYYSFLYPASWSCDQAPNGDIVLGSPNGKDAVLTFAIVSDLYPFSGDALTDKPLIEDYISSYGGKNLALTGGYMLAQAGDLRGFRATGSWRATGQDAVMLVLSGSRHMVGFVMVGNGAIALEPTFLNSVTLIGNAPKESAEGFLRFDGKDFSLDYPAHYGALDQGTAVAFINSADPNNIIMVKAYPLGMDYSDALAPAVAAGTLPKSTKVEPNAEMTEIGGRRAAVITGTVSGGPLAFYVIGEGQTALILMFTGTEATGMADAVIRSAEIK